jgi:hypothetical protein
MPRIPFSQKFWQKIKKGADDECWEWTAAVDASGYGDLILYEVANGRKVQFHTRAHRYAWTLTHGPIPEGMLICHHCDNRLCCNPNHLFVGTNSDNMLDMWRKQRHLDLRGEKNGRAKLTEQQVEEIRRLYDRKARNGGILARRYGVQGDAITRIITGRSWKKP